MSWVGRARQAAASDFVRKIAETFATRIFGLAIGVVTSMIVARILGPDGRGLYALSAAVAATATQFGNLGLHAFNTYRVAQDKNSLSALLGNSLAVSAGIGSLLIGLVLGIAALWPAVIPLQGWLLALTLVTIPLGLATLLLQNLLLGIQEIRAYNLLDMVVKVLSVVLIGAVIALQAVSVETLYVAGIIASVVGVTGTLKVLLRHLPKGPSLSLSLFKNSLPYGLKAYVAALFAFLVLKSDIFFVQNLLGTEQVGYYSIAASLIDMLYILPVVVGSILFPKLSGMSDHTERWAFAKRTLGGIALMMAAIAGVAGLLAEPAIGLIYGAAFLPAVPAFLWLLPGLVALSTNTMIMNYFASIAMPPIIVYAPLVALVANVVLNLLLIPPYGIAGAAIASTIAYSLMLTASIVYLQLSRRRAA